MGGEGGEHKDRAREKKPDQDRKRLQETMAAKEAPARKTGEARKGEKPASSAVRSAGERPTKPGEKEKAAPSSKGEKDISRGLHELRRGLPQPFEGSVPVWLRGPQMTNIGKGAELKLNETQRKNIDKEVTRWEHHSPTPLDRPTKVAGAVFLPNHETGRTSWINTSEIPKGFSRANNFLIYREGRKIEMQPRYPEDPAAIANAWRVARGSGWISPFGSENKPDDRTMKRLVETNQALNKELETQLQQGRSLSEARSQVLKNAADSFKLEVLKMFNVGLGGAGFKGVGF